MEKRRNNYIDAIRGFAILLVILGHSIIVYPINLHEIQWCKILYQFIYSFHMPLFFLVSGFCFSYKNQLKSFLIKKIKRIVLPYLCFSLLDLLSRIIFVNLVNRRFSAIEEIDRIFFYGGEYWFLYVLFELYIIFICINKLIEKNRILTNIIFFVIFLIIAIMSKYFTTIMCFSNVCYYSLFFYVGYIMKINSEKIRYVIIPKFNNYKEISCLIATFVSLWIIDEIFLNGLDTSFIIIKIITAFLGCILSVIAIYLYKFKKHLSEYGRYTMQLYLLNGFSLGISRFIICNIFHCNNAFVIIIFIFSITFYLVYFLSKYVFNSLKIFQIVFGVNTPD